MVLDCQGVNDPNWSTQNSTERSLPNSTLTSLLFCFSDLLRILGNIPFPSSSTWVKLSSLALSGGSWWIRNMAPTIKQLRTVSAHVKPHPLPENISTARGQAITSLLWTLTAGERSGIGNLQKEFDPRSIWVTVPLLLLWSSDSASVTYPPTMCDMYPGSSFG